MIINKLENLESRGKNSPDFLARYTFDVSVLPFVRAYFYKPELKEAFFTDEKLSTVNNAKTHLIYALGENSQCLDLENMKFLLAAVWGKKKDKMIDIFGYSGIDEWPGNPSIQNYVLRNGVYVQNTEEKGCADFQIVLLWPIYYRRFELPGVLSDRRAACNENLSSSQ